MPRLVVVSNRVAPIQQTRQEAGGLAVAIQAALKRQGGIWFGWNGQVIDGESPAEPTIERQDHIMHATLALGRRDHEEYYNGFANQTLWPLFHYRLGLVAVRRRNLQGYYRVNAFFAQKLLPLLDPDDIVWVHDYHLIPFARELRMLDCRQRMGFFLHTPLPAPELLQVLPNHRDLIEALCAYDLVGFHTPNDLRSFVDYIRQEDCGEVWELGDGTGGYGVRAFGRVLVARSFPISIDTQAMERLATMAGPSRHSQRLKSSLVGRKLIIGVDRLDYSKGLPQRFEAFEQLLENYPENVGGVSFLQVAPPTREEVPEYIAIRRELSELAGRINGRFAEYDWMPIRYLNKSFSQGMLAGFYRTAHIGLVTPLRDGMNLVAKEYIACQDQEDPGVLVLSQFAGAALELPEALLVNPYDVEAVADALQRALTMPKQERCERHGAMLARLREHNISWWRDSYVDALTRAASHDS